MPIALKEYPKYSEYKESGIDWLGKIPRSWGTIPIWIMLSIGRGRVISNEEILDNQGGFPVYSSQTENDGILGFINTYDFDGEYITWTTDGANAGTVFCRKGKFNCTNVCGTLKDKRLKKIDLQFMTYALNCATKYYVRYDINPKLMNNVMAGIRIQVPTYEEQHNITDFLDHKTSKIDQLIEKKQRLVELLKEKRSALINNAVTKGLDPNAKMKDSGIEWIGKIPEKWDTKRLKYISDTRVSNVDKKSEDEISVKLCNYIDVYNHEFIDENIEFMVATATPIQVRKFQLRTKDVIITKDSEEADDIGVSAYVRLGMTTNIVCGYHLALITAKESILLGKYLFRFFQAKCAKDYFEMFANGITRFGLDTYSIINTVILLPKTEEQLMIVNFLDKEIEKIDKAIVKIDAQIEKLKEYRIALISEAVTGKIKI